MKHKILKKKTYKKINISSNFNLKFEVLAGPKTHWKIVFDPMLFNIRSFFRKESQKEYLLT